MRTLLVLLSAMALAASGQQQEKPDTQQQPAATQNQPAQPAAKPAESAPAKTPREIAAGQADKTIYGDVDLGWRLRTGVGGDFNTYRSVVNLGEGPALFNADVTLQPKTFKLIDQFRLQVHTWGPDPYTTARVDAQNDRWYRFRFDYRDLALYDFLPSFANSSRSFTTPGLGTQRAFDSNRRSSDFDLTLLPSKWIVPFVAYTRSSGRGTGITNFVQTSNEYTVPTRISDHTDNYRAGVRFERMRWHLTLEAGTLKYRDDNQVFSGSVFPNLGNLNGTPQSGQVLQLTGGFESYATRGTGPYTRGILTASPFSWINITGAFLYSQPQTKTSYSETGTGNFLSFSPFLFYQGYVLLANSRALQPHPSGNVTVELRPFSRVRLFESFLTDTFHTAGTALFAQNLFTTGGVVGPFNATDAARLSMRYNQQEFQILFDLARWLTVRGGHRYVWADTTTRASIPAASLGFSAQQAEIRRNTALAGFTIHSRDRLSVTADYEGAAGDNSFFRTSLHNYQRGRVQARYQATASLQLSARFNVLDNTRPNPTYIGAGPKLDFNLVSRDNSFTAYWTPANGRWFTIVADYSRATMHSRTDYVVPSLPSQTELSEYRENAHIGTALLEIPIRVRTEAKPSVSVGGSFFLSSGSRPTQYYQPVGKVSIPLVKNVRWNTEWHWWGLSQPYYIYEGFRTHTFMTGLHLSM